MKLTSGFCATVSALTILAMTLVSSPASAADAALIAAAKKEGTVTWYSTQIISQLVRPVVQAFHKKYGITVNYVRANASEVALRVSNEAKAGKVLADVVDGTLTSVALEKQGLIAKYIPESASRLPKRYIDPKGYWTATNLFVLTTGYNTDLVPMGTEPKTYQDLLNPKWKGKMVWSSSAGSSSGTPGFVGIVLTSMGQQKGMDYLAKLAEQQITGMPVSARQVLDQVIAGEYAIGVQMFNHHAVISAAKGAHVAWFPFDPVMADFSVCSLTKSAPHPNAGKLLVDFLVSSEGQQIFREANYITVDPKIPPRDPKLRPEEGHFHAVYFTPEQIDDNIGKWAKIADQFFHIL